MSDSRRKTPKPAGRAGRPGAVSPDALPGEAMGVIEWRNEAQRSVQLSDEQLNQLKLHLGEVLGRSEPEPSPMLGEIIDLWLASISTKRVCPANEQRLVRHLLPLFLEDERSLHSNAVDALFLKLLASGLSASTVNKVRSCGRLAIDFARAGKLWRDNNPFQLVRRLKEPRRQYEQLSIAELSAAQAKLSRRRRREFRCSLYLGWRPGEMFALQKSDVDFKAGSIHIHRSHARDETKTGKERWIPILPEVAGDLMAAIMESPSEFVFPGDNGERQTNHTKLTRVLRTAMKKARVAIVGAWYRCRRHGCRKSEWRDGSVQEDIDCAACGFRLLASPRVRPFRWYDLRHMCATLSHAAGADPLCVAMVLGHSLKGETTTRAVYTHPDMAMLSVELSKWKLSS